MFGRATIRLGIGPHSSSIFFFSPNLSGRRLDVYHTSTHDVALVRNCEFRMQVWNVLQAARWKYRTQKWCKKSPSEHHCINLSGYIFATKACIDNRKKNLSSSNISSRCPYTMVNFGLLTAEIDWLVWSTPSYFNGIASWHRYCTAVTQVVGVSQTLRRWTEGATYVRRGDHHVGHWATL